MRKIETLANLSIVVASLLFCVTLAKHEWFDKSATRLPPSAQIDSALRGTQLRIDGVKWDQAEKTLVMALSTQCHFCRESTPFYKELMSSPAVKSKRVAIVTIFPQGLVEAESFIKASEIQANEVLSMPLQTIGTSATPTLLLVDRTGKVEKLWIGELSSSQQKDVEDELAKLS